jgi:hypothetical protein
MKVVIDRFEGNFAVCEKEDRTMLNIIRGKLPIKAKEGDVLTIEGATITIDEGETVDRKNVAEKLMNDVWRDNS